MKKIVALVLCLALALSLCTVAMAKNCYEVKAGELGTKDASDKWDYIVKNEGSKTDKEFTTYQFTKDGAKQDGSYYVKSDVDSATVAIVKDGKVEAYFINIGADADAKESWTTTATEVAYSDAALAEAEDCGTVVSNSTKTFYKGANGTYYYADAAGDVLLNVDGLAVCATKTTLTYTTLTNVGNDDALYVIDHVVKAELDDDDKGNVIIEEVECDECDAKLAYVTSADAAQAKWGVDGFVKVADYKDGSFTKTFFVAHAGIAASTTTSDSTTTVESAKTFDAGIALYAGMALASVAGSAVVIGKKKEF